MQRLISLILAAVCGLTSVGSARPHDASLTRPHAVSKRPPVAGQALMTPAQPRSRWIGLYADGAPSDMSPVTNVEKATGTKASVVNFFVSDAEGFPLSRAQTVAAHGATPLVTLEFWSTQNGGVSTITNGSKDAYLGAFADSAKAFGHEVWLRPLHEMNGSWYPWSGSAPNNSPAAVAAAYRHVEDVFRAHGASNVKFVWCPNNESTPNKPGYGIRDYWPGEDYVDYVAIDGYNFGTSQKWSGWRSFSQAFGPAYQTVTGLTGKPLFIAETGSSELGGNKAQWISDMFAQIPSAFPRVRGVVWFDANKETDWRVESSDASLTAFRTGAATFQQAL